MTKNPTVPPPSNFKNFEKRRVGGLFFVCLFITLVQVRLKWVLGSTSKLRHHRYSPWMVKIPARDMHRTKFLLSILNLKNKGWYSVYQCLTGSLCESHKILYHF